MSCRGARYLQGFLSYWLLKRLADQRRGLLADGNRVQRDEFRQPDQHRRRRSPEPDWRSRLPKAMNDGSALLQHRRVRAAARSSPPATHRSAWAALALRSGASIFRFSRRSRWRATAGCRLESRFTTWRTTRTSSLPTERLAGARSGRFRARAIRFLDRCSSASITCSKEGPAPKGQGARGKG